MVRPQWPYEAAREQILSDESGGCSGAGEVAGQARPSQSESAQASTGRPIGETRAGGGCCTVSAFPTINRLALPGHAPFCRASPDAPDRRVDPGLHVGVPALGSGERVRRPAVQSETSRIGFPSPGGTTRLVRVRVLPEIEPSAGCFANRASPGLKRPRRTSLTCHPSPPRYFRQRPSSPNSPNVRRYGR
jgi:hypothetical protein